MHWLGADVWPLHPTTCHLQSFQPINRRLTSGLGKKLEGDASKPRQSVTMNFAKIWKENLLPPCQCIPHKKRQKSKSTLGFTFSKAEASDIWPNKANFSNQAKIFSTFKIQKCAHCKVCQSSFLLRPWLCTSSTSSSSSTFHFPFLQSICVVPSMRESCEERACKSLHCLRLCLATHKLNKELLLLIKAILQQMFLVSAETQCYIYFEETAEKYTFEFRFLSALSST